MTVLCPVMQSPGEQELGFPITTLSGALPKGNSGSRGCSSPSWSSVRGAILLEAGRPGSSGASEKPRGEGHSEDSAACPHDPPRHLDPSPTSTANTDLAFVAQKN